jgi:hypothetical protein
MMMMRMNGVALLLGMLSLNVAPLGAIEVADAGPAEVNVTNHYWTAVQVYAEDSKGALHFLGRVDRNEFQLFEVPDPVSELGEFRLKLYPREIDARSPRSTSGIKTRPLQLQEGDVALLLLTDDLSASELVVERG